MSTKTSGTGVGGVIMTPPRRRWRIPGALAWVAVTPFAAWALARILGSIPITPGGIGIVELSLS